MAALVLLSGITDWLSARVRQVLGAPARLEVNLAPGCEAQAAQLTRAAPSSRGLLALLGLAVLVVPLALVYLQPDFGRLVSPRTQALLGQMLAEMFPPDLSGDQIARLLQLSLQTLAMSIVAMAIAGLFGLALAHPAARRESGPRWPYWLTRGGLLVLRAVPAPVWALLFLFVMFPGPLPGALALAVHNLGILGRLIAEAVENVDQRPTRALQHAGAPPPTLSSMALCR